MNVFDLYFYNGENRQRCKFSNRKLCSSSGISEEKDERCAKERGGKKKRGKGERDNRKDTKVREAE